METGFTKKTIDKMRERIAKLNAEIEAIQSLCHHRNTKQVNNGYRIGGCEIKATMCSDCYKIL